MRDGRIEFMTVDQVIAESGDSKTTVYYHIRAGHLPVTRLYAKRGILVKRKDFEKWNKRRARSDRGKRGGQ